jgi:gliding motility-associated-like protein
VTFTPVLNFSGTASITYTVNDNNGATSNAAIVSVNVAPVNDAPVAVNDNPSTNEDTPATFNVTTNDTDIDDPINVATVDLDPATAGIQTTFTSAEGAWSVDNAGNVTFTPTLNFTGTASITYTVNDNSGATSNAATIAVTVNPVNDAPVAVNDNTTTNEDTPTTFNVTSNDTDVDGTVDATTVDLDPASAGIQNTFTSTEGTWTVGAGGDVTYTPALNFNGTATISYTVNDNNGLTSNAATITVTVAPVNDAPVAVNDNTSTNEDTPVTVLVTANDTDVDGTINVATVDFDQTQAGIQQTATTAEGTWSANTTGNVTFTPASNFTGTATIQYTVNDNNGAISNQATITITINPVNDAPVAVNDNQTTNEDVPLSFSVTNNDTDVDGTINVTSVDLDPTTPGIQNTFTSPEGGWNVSGTGNVTFTPNLNFFGTASINYTVNDDSGATSNAAVITVTVLPVNDAPVAVNDSPVTDEDTPVTFDVTANDTDIDGTIDDNTVDLDQVTLGIQHTFTTPQGTWLSNTNGYVTFTPAANFNGTATLNYTVNDDGGLKSNVATITVTVNPVNDAPVAVSDNPSTNEDTPVTFNITNNDTDVDGTVDPATIDLNPSVPGIQKTTSTIAGAWSVDNNGNVTFTPEPDFNGTATLTYTVADNLGATSAPGVISVTVQTINDTPVAVADNFVTDEDTPATFNVVTNDTDSDGSIDPATVDLDPATAGVQHVITTAAGTWVADPSGNVTFNPVLNFNGTASISYTVQDDEGTVSNTVSIVFTVNPVNDAPVLTNKSFAATQGVPVVGNLLTGDSDPDGTLLSVTLTPVTPPAHGTLNLTPDGNFTYTPDIGYTGADAIEIQVCDNGTPLPAACATKTITFNVVSNRPPVVSNKTPQTNEDVVLTGQILAPGDNDPEGSALVVNSTPVQVPAHGTIVIRPDGGYTYTPARDYNGQDSVKVEVCDSSPVPSCTTMTIRITINAVNDAPVLNTSTVTALVNGTVAGNTLAGDVDPEGTDLVVSTTPVSGPLHGTITIDANGQFQYTPTANFIGLDTVVLEVCDQGLPLPAICASDTLVIAVGNPGGLDVYIPEGFSPNGDGVNDAFVIGYNGSESIQLEVYNRWGNLVYKNHNYQNDWRGNAMYGIVIGTEVPDGTYFYKIRVGSFQKVKSFTIQR